MGLALFRRAHPTLVWSNPEAPDEVWLRAALLHPRFEWLLAAAVEAGLPALLREWERLLAENAEETRRVASATARVLDHLKEGARRAASGN